MAEYDIIVLSYGRPGRPDIMEADRLVSLLRERGFSIWFDQWDLLPGTAGALAIEEALAQARSALVLISGEGAVRSRSDELDFLIQQSVERGFPLIPVLLPGASEKVQLTPFLQAVAWLDLRNGISVYDIDLLLTTISKRGERRLPPQSSTSWGPRPILSGIGAFLVILLGWLLFQVSPSPPPSPPPNPPVLVGPNSHSYNQTMDEELRQAWRNLREGKIAYNPNSRMIQGKPEEVTARIAPDTQTDLSKGLKGTPWIERLRTSGSMAAYLEGAPEEFEIRARNSTRQAIVGPYTDWVWDVTPLKGGKCDLVLRVVARIRLSNKENEEKDVVVKRARITVDVDPRWKVNRFVVANWQWLLGSPIVLGVLAWLVTKTKSWPNKRKQIGFENQPSPNQPAKSRSKKRPFLR